MELFLQVLSSNAFSILRPDAFYSWQPINITRQISLLVVIGLGATLVMCVEN